MVRDQQVVPRFMKNPKKTRPHAPCDTRTVYLGSCRDYFLSSFFSYAWILEGVFSEPRGEVRQSLPRRKLLLLHTLTILCFVAHHITSGTHFVRTSLL